MAAASSSTPTSDSVVSSRIECPVCCEIFRSPKCLTCGHSVCADCCQKLLPILGNSILCPVCRRPTNVPAGGLPTNFALQDLIQDYQNNDEQRRYRCIECDRSCTADEAWLMNTVPEEEIMPRCFRCIIVQYFGAESAASALPAGMESVTDRIRRHDGDLSKLKRRLATVSNEQREWTRNVQQAAHTMKIRVDDIVQSSQELQKLTLESVDKLNHEFEILNAQTNSANVPQSLEELNAFKESIKNTSSKLDHLADARRRTITRTNVALNSLTIGLDCLLNSGEDKSGRESVGDEAGSSRGDGDGFVTPPQERQPEPRNVASLFRPALVASSPASASPTASAVTQSANSGQQLSTPVSASPSPNTAAPSPVSNVFSLYYPMRGQRRVYAVQVRRGRARPSGFRPQQNPNP